MTMPYPQPPLPPQPVKRSKLPWVVAAVATVAALVAVGVMAANDTGQDGSTAPAAAGTTTTTETVHTPETVVEETPEPVLFSPKDFTLKIKVLSKECFGSAGCLIEYRVVPTYTGVESDFDATSLEITYKVTGASDGAQLNTFTMDDGSYDVYDLEGMADTSSSSAKLTAKVTEVVTW